MFCCPRCSHLSTILNNIVEPESGVTILLNIVDSYEQCGQQNIVQSCFHQYCINLSVFTRVYIMEETTSLYEDMDNYKMSFVITSLTIWLLVFYGFTIYNFGNLLKLYIKLINYYHAVTSVLSFQLRTNWSYTP